MTVSVESNFMLEIALGQREAPAAESILAFALQRGVSLVVPSFALFAPFATVKQRGHKLKKLMNDMNDEKRQLKRSQPHEQDLLELEPLAGVFTAIHEREIDRLNSTVHRLSEVAEIIEISERRIGLFFA